MTTNWIAKQALHGVAQFDQAMVHAYPESQASLRSAQDYIGTVGEVCNYIEASKKIPWASYFPANATILDLGCGGGWLTAMLSRFDAVQAIYALDSSQHFLHKMLPQVMDLMKGRPEKLITIEGLFVPLFFENEQFDAVVASSALHHADNLETVLREIRRCLKPGGRLFVINETPWPGYRHLLSVMAAGARIVRDLVLQRYQAVSPAVSSSGYLYDPALGDRDYPVWYWRKALESAGFVVESVVDTGLPTLKGSRGRPLIHFVCRAN